jgi:hypothetical protein
MTSQLRLVVVPGPHGALLLDDTYNSNPDSALAALNLLSDLDGRRIAVLGDMLELGDAEYQGASTGRPAGGGCGHDGDRGWPNELKSSLRKRSQPA